MIYIIELITSAIFFLPFIVYLINRTIKLIRQHKLDENWLTIAFGSRRKRMGLGIVFGIYWMIKLPIIGLFWICFIVTLFVWTNIYMYVHK